MSAFKGRPNGTRFPEFDQEAVQIWPPHNGISVDQVMKTVHVEKDSLEISMISCDGFECYGDPWGSQRSAPKCDMLQFCRF